MEEVNSVNVLKEELEEVVSKMTALVGGWTPLQAYLSDNICSSSSAFTVPPAIPSGMCDYQQYNKEIQTLQKQMENSLKGQKCAVTVVETFKKKMDMSDRHHCSDLNAKQNTFTQKQMEAMEHRRRLHSFIENTIPIDGPKFQAEMQHLIDEKLRLLTLIRQAEIAVFHAANKKRAKKAAMAEAAAFAGGV